MRSALLAALLTLAGLSPLPVEAGFIDIFAQEPVETVCEHCGQVHHDTGYYEQHTTTLYQHDYQYVESSPGLFGQIWALEQRKNAWLMRTFFGE